MQPDYLIALEERRQATRFPKEESSEFAAVWKRPGDELLAEVEVHDESLGGISLVLDDVAETPVGASVHLAYAGQYCTATVRHWQPRSDGRFLVGFECTPLAEESRES